jgi:hypothetical protein
MFVMASKDLANVVISASRSEEMSHMTVLIVVMVHFSGGGISMRPSGIGISVSWGLT